MAALREGNARRLEMAAYRRHLRSLTTDDAIREVTYALKRMDDAPAYVTRLRVEWLFASIPAVGPMKRDRLLLQAAGERAAPVGGADGEAAGEVVHDASRPRVAVKPG